MLCFCCVGPHFQKMQLNVMETVIKLYHTTTKEMFTNLDLSMSGKTRKTFQAKYGLGLRQILLHILVHCPSINPMSITMRYVNDDTPCFDYYAEHIKCKNNKVELSGIQCNIIDEIMQEYPERIYLFHCTESAPDKLTPTDKRNITSAYCKLLKGCSDKLSIPFVKQLALSDSCSECTKKSLQILYLKAQNEALNIQLMRYKNART